MLSFSRILGISSLGLMIPTPASAHTRWFAESGLPPYATDEPTALYLSVWALVVFIVVLLGVYLERRGKLQLASLLPTRDHAFSRASATFSMVAGAFFVIAGTHEYLFSPNLSVESGIPYALLVVQIFVGLAFLTGVFARVAAVALFGLWLAVLGYGGTLSMLENAWVLGTAGFIFIMGSDYFSLVPFRALAHVTRPLHAWALPLLRIGAGVTLLVLGFSEKILHPEFGINFLSIYQWNFTQLFGFSWYSDYLFTLSAGAVESLLGLIFILGVLTRLNAFVVLVIFAIPMFILGPVELAGHLPHLSAVVLLLLFGGGNKLKVPDPNHHRYVHHS